MISKALFSSIATLMLAASHASAATGAVQAAIDCSSPNLSAAGLNHCAGVAAATDEFQNKLEALTSVGGSLPVNGNRKLLTEKAVYVAKDLDVKTVECKEAEPAALRKGCMDDGGGVKVPIACNEGLLCVKFTAHYAQCLMPNHEFNTKPYGVLKCGAPMGNIEVDSITSTSSDEDEEQGTEDVGSGNSSNSDSSVDPGTPDDVFGSDEPSSVVPTPAASEPETSEPETTDPETPSSNPAPAPEDSAPTPSTETPEDTSSEPSPAPETPTTGGTDTTTLSSGGPNESCPSKDKWSLGDWNLAEAIGKNFLFFEAQESGELPASHRVKWRGDSYLHDKHKDRLLNYGWFDAGDHLKLVFPMGWTISTMAWGIIDGANMLKGQSFDGSNNLKWAIGTLEYGLKFLLDCSYDDGEFVAQVGATDIDHKYVLRAELDDITPRTDGTTVEDTGIFYTLLPMQPGADLYFQAAAAYAAGAMALKSGAEVGGGSEALGSEALATRAEGKAKELYKLAEENPGLYSDSIKEAAKTYKSDNWQQYGYLASAWLLRLTKNDMYKKKAEMYMKESSQKGTWADYSWASVYFGATAVMWQETGEDMYEAKLAQFASDQLSAAGTIMHTPGGLIYLNEWGPIRHAVGSAGILGLYARGLKEKSATSSMGQSPEEIIAFAESQITYTLGASGHSWMVGFGCNPPVNPHHRDSALLMSESGSWAIWEERKVNANSLIGAVVGGPDKQDKGNDDRNDYRLNEVALDYNSAFFFGTSQVAAYFS